jgi:next-to-BRCA1 protein 1
MRHEGPVNFLRAPVVKPAVAAADEVDDDAADKAGLEMTEREGPALVSSGRQPSLSSTVSATRTAAAPAAPHATFIEHGTVADGDIFPAGARFTKSWVLENASGEQAFGPGSVLCWTGGDDLSPSSSSSPPGAATANDAREVDVGFVGPKERFVVKVEMQAPDRPGRYITYWRLRQGGHEFGERVWAE